jgi:hypothetical protein
VRRGGRTTLADREAILLFIFARERAVPVRRFGCLLKAILHVFRDHRPNGLDACVHGFKGQASLQPESGMARRSGRNYPHQSATVARVPTPPADASEQHSAPVRSTLTTRPLSTCRSEHPESNAADDRIGREPAACSLAAGTAPSPSLRSRPTRGRRCRIWRVGRAHCCAGPGGATPPGYSPPSGLSLT